MFQVIARSVVCAVLEVETHVGRAVGGTAMGATAGQIGYHVDNTGRHKIEETVPGNKKRPKSNDGQTVFSEDIA